jgi:hypothetical protein
MDQPIPDYYQSEDGEFHDFIGVTQAGTDDLKLDQSVLHPGLLYQARNTRNKALIVLDKHNHVFATCSVDSPDVQNWIDRVRQNKKAARLIKVSKSEAKRYLGKVFHD